jgi:hypothetical protein
MSAAQVAAAGEREITEPLDLMYVHKEKERSL